jgi:hypothetical protein
VTKAKSIKDQNRWQLWLAIVANVVVFYIVMQWDDVSAAGVKTLINKAANILPVGLAIVVTTVVNGLLSPDAKARIVFLRWTHALPGHRAFSDLAPKDTRIDLIRLKKACGNKLPTVPNDQNSTWYRLYKTVEKHPSVEHAQRDFLFTRDYATFAALCLLGFGSAAFVELQSIKVAMLYLAALAGQFILVRQAAMNYGNRFVTTVMAEKSASSASPRQPSKRRT